MWPAIEAEKPKAEEPEPEEGRQLDALDDPVRICMNQMAKCRCSRASRVEVCQRIEEAELEMKRLVYSLGFTAKSTARLPKASLRTAQGVSTAS